MVKLLVFIMRLQRFLYLVSFGGERSDAPLLINTLVYYALH
jgi:hypothetical protein